MQQRAVSIIIPCYNVKEYLPRCVSSLLDQTIGLERLELIFVNDASTDGTLDYLYQIEQQYPEAVMVVTYPENQGLGAARNIGMGYATGKYIGFVDADDWVQPQMYEEMYEKAEETGCELVSSYPYQTSDEKNEAPGRIQDESCDQIYFIQNDAQRRELLAAGMSIFGTVNVCSKLYCRDLIEENDLRFGEGYAFEDLYFSDMAAFYVNRFCVMQAQYYDYYIRPGSIMTTMDCERWYEQREIMQVWLQECIDRGLSEVYPDEIELIFGRDYYVSNLHYVFTRGRGEEDEIVHKTQMVTKALFPDIEKNPYILRDGEAHIRDCQKRLFAYVSKGFGPGEIWRVREDYLRDALELVHKERAEKK